MNSIIVADLLMEYSTEVISVTGEFEAIIDTLLDDAEDRLNKAVTELLRAAIEYLVENR